MSDDEEHGGTGGDVFVSSASLYQIRDTVSLFSVHYSPHEC